MVSKQSITRSSESRTSSLEPSANQVATSLLEIQAHMDARMEKLTELSKTQQDIRPKEMVSKFPRELGEEYEVVQGTTR